MLTVKQVIQKKVNHNSAVVQILRIHKNNHHLLREDNPEISDDVE